MSKLEFYYELLKILNGHFRWHFLQKARAYKDILKNLPACIGRKQFKKLNYYKPIQCGIYKKISFTYKDACIMYDSLSNRNWEFKDDKIVIHYDEIVMTNGNIINDIYLKFNPIIYQDILYPDLLALRATYTSLEYNLNFCHPHIRFNNPESGFSNLVCFGITPFLQSDNVLLNFLSYLDYLDLFIKHESNVGQPYISTDYVKKWGMRISTRLISVDFTKLDYTFESVNGIEYVVPDYTEKTIKYLESIGCEGLFITSANGWDYIDKGVNLEDPINIFTETFKGERIKLKIIEPTKLVFNESFAKKFNNQTRGFLTEIYMEAHSRNFKTSNTPSTVSL